jgi:hypothetical protein
VFKSSAGVEGITGMKIKRDRKTEGQYKFTVKGKGGDFRGLNLPDSLTMAFDVTALDPAESARAQWPGLPYALQTCRAKGGGTTTICK